MNRVWRFLHLEDDIRSAIRYHLDGLHEDRPPVPQAFYRYYGMRYAKRGYVVACIYYRYPGKFPFPTPVQDAKCAVRWMRANAAAYHVNPDKIGAMGIGIGGYLAMMLAYTPRLSELEGDGEAASRRRISHWHVVTWKRYYLE